MLGCALVALLGWANAAGAMSRDSLERRAAATLLAEGRHPAMRWGRLDDVRHSLAALHDTTGDWRPLWLVDGQPSPQARAVLLVLADAAAVGLRPADFDAGRLSALASWLETPYHRASFELALSANAARYLRAVREGRVEPSEAHAALNIPRPPFDVVAAVHALARSPDVAAAMRAHEPPFTHYQRVKESLARLRALAAETTLTRLPALPGGKSVRVGEAWDGVPALQRLLVALGDASGPVTALLDPADSLRVTAPLAEALAHFQRRTGLEADGVLGRATLATLTRPLGDKRRALELTLERWRWLPHVFEAPPLIVNVPAFRFYGFSGDGDDESEVLRMDVVVGRAFDTRTPIFSDTLTTLVFAPYWDVPPGILRRDILPRVRRDAGYLAKNGYEVVRGWGDEAPVLGAGAEAIAELLAGRARVRQRPGPSNAMGRVKFLFPNDFNVYFHDTPAQAAFGAARRDLSNGCVRLSDPMALVKLLLADDPSWTEERIAAAVARNRPTYVRLRRPRPVFLLYATAMTTQDGETRFYPDIYGYDDELARRLDAGFPFHTERPLRAAR